MKKWLILAGVGIMIMAGVGGGCSYSALDTARRILKTQFSSSNLSYKTFRWCTNGLPFVDKIESILGGKYIILLQNNTELRPTGGFVGSYATISTDKAGIKRIQIQDIYEPDGKLPGHVEPPYPIQEAFGQGWWKLRDANWDPDFASAAGAVRWFMEQGGEANIQGILAVNQLTIKQLISIYGPIKLTTYDEIITDKNFYNLAQKYAETRTVGNKTDKRGFLGAVGVALEERIKISKLIDLINLSALIFKELRKGEILVWMKDAEIQKEIEFRKWGGRLSDNWNGKDDYIYVVDSNLGANKANCCVARDITHEITHEGKPEEHVIREKLTIKWVNNNEFEHPKPPIFWGGNYWNYVRIIVPASLKIQAVKVQEKNLRQATESDFDKPNALRQGLSEDMYVVEQRGDLQIIGFWAVVEAGKQVKAEVSYTSPYPSPTLGEGIKGRGLLIKHQPGSGVTNYQILKDGVVKDKGQLDRDKVVVIE